MINLVCYFILLTASLIWVFLHPRRRPMTEEEYREHFQVHIMGMPEK